MFIFVSEMSLLTNFLKRMKMKKILVIMLAMLTMCFSFSSCSSDDDDKFDYPMETLCGTWNLTDVQLSSGKWVDVTGWQYSEYRASITFYSDGTYYGKGALGNGRGTYKSSGNTIVTYVGGEEYIRYTIKSVNNNEMEGTMYDDSGSINFKAKKQ